MNFDLLEGEVFRNLNVEGYEHYLVSNMGRVSYKNKLRKITPSKRDYARLRLSSGSDRKYMSVHRMVCLTFLGKPKGDSNYVNHKNFNTMDNRLENLEWVTPKQNHQHFMDNKWVSNAKKKEEKTIPPWIDLDKLRKQSKKANELAVIARKKKIKLINIKTKEEKIFDSAVEMEKTTGICRKAIGSVARGQRKTHKGYTAEYI